MKIHIILIIFLLFSCNNNFRINSHRKKGDSFKGHKGEINYIEFDKSGYLFATAGEDCIAKIWDSDTGILVKEFKGHKKSIEIVKFTDDNKIITVSVDKTIKIWSILDGSLLISIDNPFEKTSSIDVNNNKIVVSGWFEPNANVWDINSGVFLFSLVGHSNWINKSIFSLDGKLIATASYDHTVKIWNSSSGELIQTITEHSKAISDINFSKDKLITASVDNTAKLLNDNQAPTLFLHKSWIGSAIFNNKENQIATCSDDHEIKIWSLDGTLLKLIKNDFGIQKCKYSYDDSLIVAYGTVIDKTPLGFHSVLSVFYISKNIEIFKNDDFKTTDFDLSRSKNTMILVNRDGFIKIIDLTNQKIY